MTEGKTAKPRIIVVLGMHRSGTSVTTNLLNAFGVALSDDLMEPTPENAKGYFESMQISKINDDILAALGMEWKTASLVAAFPRDWWRSPAMQVFKERLAAIVMRELSRHGGLWGFKDPRTARLLPMWIELIAELNLDARYVLVSRHPVDVAKSLFSREQITPMHAELMWLDHNADAILNLQGKVDAIVEYHAWIDNPVDQALYMIERLGLPWKGSREDVERITAEVVAADLRHHVTVENAFRLPITAPFYDALVRRDVARLQQLSEVYNVTRAFTRTVLADATQSLSGQITQLTNQTHEQRTRILDLEARLRALTSS